MTYKEAKKAVDGKRVFRAALLQFNTKVPRCIKNTRYDQYKYISDTVFQDKYDDDFKPLKEQFFVDSKDALGCAYNYIMERANSAPQEIRHRYYRSEVIIVDNNNGCENEETFISSGIVAYYYVNTGRRVNFDGELTNYEIETIAEEAIKKGLCELDMDALQEEYVLSHIETCRLKNCMIRLLRDDENNYQEDYEI